MRTTCAYAAFFLLILATALAGDSTPPRRDPLVVGIDCNYVLQMESAGAKWASASAEAAAPTASGPGTSAGAFASSPDPFHTFAALGATSIRIRLWVGEEGVNRMAYALETAKRARAAGLKPCLVLFLSEEWADMVKQPAPAAWRSLDPAAKAAAIEAYAEAAVRRFAAEGIDVELVEIGNEIDFGICGVFEEEWKHRVNLDYMRDHIWSAMAPLIAAAQRGVLRARPGARFILHLAQWNSPDYCAAFWRYMAAAGVRVDFPGLSYFPTSAADPTHRTLAHLHAQIAAMRRAGIDKPFIISEFAYPAIAEFTGQFADWNKPAEGYPLTEAGQAAWLRDFLDWARTGAAPGVKQPASPSPIAACYYWSPEWYTEPMWHAFALFGPKGELRPAAASLQGKGEASKNVKDR
ncbi:hypothetical protein DB346_08910 [Verrucomicrobia bacterium LW23]|nr:hypothetical protein DB346_08910 [Verrucomicrobia bacterium LW23]